MDNVIVGYVDSMSLTQKLTLPNGSVVDVDSSTYIPYLMGLCKSENVYKIHLFGNIHYIEGIVDTIEQHEIAQYGKKKIEIEVN